MPIPSISVITVAYNSESTISETIVSVLNQTHAPMEYIIIDGKSTDRTVVVASEFAPRFQERNIQYRIVSERDNGIYDAMNKGIDLATGDVIGIINSDDWYEPIALECVYNSYLKTPFDYFYADLRIIKENGGFIKRAKLSRFATSRYWNHPTTFVARSIYDRYRYKQQTIYDDWDFILRLKKNGCKAVIANETLANFRFGGVSNRKSLSNTAKRIKLKYRIYRQNGYHPLYIFDCILMETAKYLFS